MGADTPFSDRFFVAGHLAKGAVYTLIGGLALATVFTAGGEVSGTKDVLKFIQEQPFGKILVVLIALGMLCYCIWRWIKAVEDTSDEGKDAEGLIKRTAFAVSGTLYGVLAVTFLIGVFSGGGSGGGTGKKSLVETFMGSTWGMIAVGAVAFIMAAVAFFQAKRAHSESYLEEVRTGEMSAREHKTYRILGKVGFYSRAVVYAVIAYFLVRVLLSGDADKFKGVAGALEWLAQGAGVILFAVVSLGLLFYGVFMFVKARYRPA